MPGAHAWGSSSLAPRARTCLFSSPCHGHRTFSLRCSLDCCWFAVFWRQRRRGIRRCTRIVSRTRTPACSACWATANSTSQRPPKSGSTGAPRPQSRYRSLRSLPPLPPPTASRPAARRPSASPAPKVEGRRGRRTPIRTSGFQPFLPVAGVMTSRKQAWPAGGATQLLQESKNHPRSRCGRGFSER